MKNLLWFRSPADFIFPPGQKLLMFWHHPVEIYHLQDRITCSCTNTAQSQNSKVDMPQTLLGTQRLHNTPPFNFFWEVIIAWQFFYICRESQLVNITGHCVCCFLPMCSVTGIGPTKTREAASRHRDVRGPWVVVWHWHRRRVTFTLYFDFCLSVWVLVFSDRWFILSTFVNFADNTVGVVSPPVGWSRHPLGSANEPLWPGVVTPVLPVICAQHIAGVFSLSEDGTNLIQVICCGKAWGGCCPQALKRVWLVKSTGSSWRFPRKRC